MTDRRPRREFLARALTLGTTLAVAGGALPCCLLRVIAADAPPDKRLRPIEELAYCGFDCETECDTYQASLHSDLEAKRKIAERWNRKYGLSVRPEDVACDGCRSRTGRLGYHCENICEVRKCGRARPIASCAACADFPGCDRQLWQGWPEMRQRTEHRRRTRRDGGQPAAPG